MYSCTPIPLSVSLICSWRSRRFFKIFEIATEALTFAKTWDLGAASTSSTILLLSLQFTCVSAMHEAQLNGLKRHFFLSATTTKDFQLRLVCAYDNTSCYDQSAGISLVLRLCCDLKPLLCKSAANRGSANRGSAVVDYQLSNKMDNLIAPVAIIQRAIINKNR